MDLGNGWVVVDEFPPLSRTGGAFSYCYKVRHDDQRKAFLKALDYSRALKAPDPPAALQALTAAYLFERAVLETCRTRGMDRVVQSIESGRILVDHTDLGNVDYLIFEMADHDVRSFLSQAGAVDVAWKLRSLHHCATGLNQLHTAGIAHQDLKPSNILVFEKTTSKIADLGSASQKGTPSPRDHRSYAGDPSYAPPELLYGYLDADWAKRRMGCDAYLLGSMIVFMFTGLGATSLLLSKMTADHHYRNWRGAYPEVLPYIREAFGQLLETVERSIPEAGVGAEVGRLVEYLCEPDPSLRGHPLNRTGHVPRLSLERFVSKLDLLAQKAELHLKRR